MPSTTGKDKVRPRLQSISKPEVDHGRRASTAVDSAKNLNPLTAKAFPTKGVHHRDVSHSR